VNIEWSQSAVASLDAIVAYASQFSAQYAARIRSRLVNRVAQLGDYPMLGKMIPEYGIEEIRELSEPPYRVLYRVRHDSIEILNIVHGARLLRP